MSGGRFNYMDSTLLNEIFGWNVSEDNIPNIFEDIEISELIYDVLILMHDFDWYASGDTGEETWIKKKKEFKKKWLGGTPRKDMIKRMIEKSLSESREELYKTFSLK